MIVNAREAVLVLAGPTASGKSELALELARRFGAEIVNADSRQIYRGMPIGTAAPPAEALGEVPHHLYGFLDPSQRYSAARYAQEATAAVEAILARGSRAIVVGGTGFYVRALTGGVDLAPRADEATRNRIAREAQLHDTAFLHEWLSVRNPERAAAIHPGDAYRILRALEVTLAGGDAHRSAPVRTLRTAAIPFVKVFLDVDDAQLEVRIAARTNRMLAAGFLDEAERIGAQAVAADAVGYPQALAYLAGRCTDEELRRALVRATRRYARRQAAWFRREPETVWMTQEAAEPLAREKLGWV